MNPVQTKPSAAQPYLIDDLIAQLTEIRKAHGNLPVKRMRHDSLTANKPVRMGDALFFLGDRRTPEVPEAVVFT